MKKASDIEKQDLLHHYFEKQVHKNPGQIALIWKDWHLSYEELDYRADQWVQLFLQKGLQANDRIGLWLEKSVDLYAAMLAILKAGMSYIPLDPSFPIERVHYILNDANAACLVTSNELAQSIDSKLPLITLLLEDLDLHPVESQIERMTDTHLSPNLAYIIYTSGTTGKPKGVGISHQNACHYVYAASHVYGIKSTDRVYQGFSLAFDSSVEEIWLTWANGATLVIPSSASISAGAGLEFLDSKQITVLSCVPTLLAMLDTNFQSLRLLIFGGEVCPSKLIKRCERPGLRILNTYGPTEATVVTTASECFANQEVTIGKPLPGYQIFILDEHLQPVLEGNAGELCIGGPSVAAGYLNRPELNAQKFVIHPHHPEINIYRTGDLVRSNQNGDLEYLGRIDDQVKFRGFRVELTEIDARLLEYPNIKFAATAVKELSEGLPTLVAYLTLADPNQILDEHELMLFLQQDLPHYMVPSLYEFIDTIPTLPSGKIDRKKLPLPKWRKTVLNKDYVPPGDDLEKKLVGMWEDLFKHSPISIRADFFYDLEGHSLFAAKFISMLRKEPELHFLSMMDLYDNPTIEKLAIKLRELKSEKQQQLYNTPTNPEETQQIKKRFWNCAFWQGVASYFTFGISSWQFLGIFLSLSYLALDYDLFSKEFVFALSAILLLLNPVLFMLGIVSKWVILGKIKPGRYPLWGRYYFRWWLVQRIISQLPTDYLTGSPLINLYLRLMGAKIGKHCYIATDMITSFDLLHIGDHSSVGSEVSLLGYTVENGYLYIGDIKIGENCYVGANSSLGIGTTMEDGSALDANTLLTPGAIVFKGKTLGGSPAIEAPHLRDRLNELAHQKNNSQMSWFMSLGWHLSFYLLLQLFLVIYTVSVLPGIVVIDTLYDEEMYLEILLAIPFAALFMVVFTGIAIVILKKIFLSSVRPGITSIKSFYFIRKWFVEKLMNYSLTELATVYATVFTPFWLRSLGAKVGKRTEISTLVPVVPDLLNIGDETFLADGTSIGIEYIFAGYVKISPNYIGSRSFIGNSAIIQSGIEIGEGSLLGCLSIPASDVGKMESHTSWLGSPAVQLPKREILAGFFEKDTFQPSFLVFALRVLFDFVRVLLPGTLGFFLFSSYVFSIYYLDDIFSLWQTIALFPLVDIALITTAVLSMIALKWILIGRFKDATKPAWSSFVFRNELVTGLYDAFVDPMFFSQLLGTPFISPFLRLLGAKIGKRVYLDSTFFTEFDLVNIGHDVAINASATIQTHLFEDRVMKMARLKIGDNCTVGSFSIVLYDTVMNKGAYLASLSLLMKGENMPEGSYFEGIPARPKLSENNQNLPFIQEQDSANTIGKVPWNLNRIIQSRRLRRQIVLH